MEAYVNLTMGVVGGLGMFLFGMTLLSQGLQAMGANYIKRTIHFVTQNRVLAVLVGFIVTAIIQSSSVSTVMMSGFMNAGLMTLQQGVGFVFGAGIGTTVTGYIVSLKVTEYGLLLVGVGAIPYLFSAKPWIKNVSRLFLALGFIFFGLDCMAAVFQPLKSDADFLHFMQMFDAKSWWSILACMFIGCVLTMIIQSSSAMLAVTITLAGQGVIGFEAAVALVMGENIGTTITLWLASLGCQRIVKQLALAQTMFKASGCLLVFLLFKPYLHLSEWVVGLFYTQDVEVFDAAGKLVCVNAWYIAGAHTLFNILLTVVYTPLLNYLVRFSQWAIPIRSDNEEQFHFFKTSKGRSGLSPIVMINQSTIVLKHLFDITRESVELMRDVLIDGQSDSDAVERIHAIEGEADEIQKEIVLYLSKTIQIGASVEQNKQLQAIIHASDELESITDYCENIAKYKTRLDENNVILNRDSRALLEPFLNQTAEFFAQSQEWLRDPKSIHLPEIMARYQELNVMANAIRNEHLVMLQDRKYPPLFALTFSDIMVAIRRIKNHTLNLAETQLSGSGKF